MEKKDDGGEAVRGVVQRPHTAIDELLGERCAHAQSRWSPAVGSEHKAGQRNGAQHTLTVTHVQAGGETAPDGALTRTTHALPQQTTFSGLALDDIVPKSSDDTTALLLLKRVHRLLSKPDYLTMENVVKHQNLLVKFMIAREKVSDPMRDAINRAQKLLEAAEDRYREEMGPSVREPMLSVDQISQPRSGNGGNTPGPSVCYPKHVSDESVPKFDGRPLSWLTWTKGFGDLVERNPHLPETRKAYLLSLAMPPRFQTMVEDYDLDWRSAIEAVRRVVENPANIRRDIMERLSECPRLSDHATLEEWRQFRDTLAEFERHARPYLDLSETVKDCLLQLLPREQNFEFTVYQRGRTLADLRKFVDMIIEGYEQIFCQQPMTKLVGTNNATISGKQTHAYVVELDDESGSAGKRKDATKCTFCEDPHLRKDCPLKRFERREAVLTKGLCYGCLEAWDRDHRCNYRCSSCGKKEHITLCRTSGGQRKGGSTLQDLRNFVKTIVRGHELMVSSPPSSESGGITRAGSSGQRRHVYTVSVNDNDRGDERRYSPKCTFCDKAHWRKDCPLNRRERRAATRRKRLCFGCLRTWENDHRCEYRCKLCGRPEHISLCERSNQPQPENGKPVTETVATVDTTAATTKAKETVTVETCSAISVAPVDRDTVSEVVSCKIQTKETEVPSPCLTTSSVPVDVKDLIHVSGGYENGCSDSDPNVHLPTMESKDRDVADTMPIGHEDAMYSSRINYEHNEAGSDTNSMENLPDSGSSDLFYSAPTGAELGEKNFPTSPRAVHAHGVGSTSREEEREEGAVAPRQSEIILAKRRQVTNVDSGRVTEPVEIGKVQCDCEDLRRESRMTETDREMVPMVRADWLRKSAKSIWNDAIRKRRLVSLSDNDNYCPDTYCPLARVQVLVWKKRLKSVAAVITALGTSDSGMYEWSRRTPLRLSKNDNQRFYGLATNEAEAIIRAASELQVSAAMISDTYWPLVRAPGHVWKMRLKAVASVTTVPEISDSKMFELYRETTLQLPMLVNRRFRGLAAKEADTIARKANELQVPAATISDMIIRKANELQIPAATISDAIIWKASKLRVSTATTSEALSTTKCAIRKRFEEAVGRSKKTTTKPGRWTRHATPWRCLWEPESQSGPRLYETFRKVNPINTKRIRKPDGSKRYNMERKRCVVPVSRKDNHRSNTNIPVAHVQYFVWKRRFKSQGQRDRFGKIGDVLIESSFADTLDGEKTVGHFVLNLPKFSGSATTFVRPLFNALMARFNKGCSNDCTFKRTWIHTMWMEALPKWRTDSTMVSTSSRTDTKMTSASSRSNWMLQEVQLVIKIGTISRSDKTPAWAGELLAKSKEGPHVITVEVSIFDVGSRTKRTQAEVEISPRYQRKFGWIGERISDRDGRIKPAERPNLDGWSYRPPPEPPPSPYRKGSDESAIDPSWTNVAGRRMSRQSRDFKMSQKGRLMALSDDGRVR